MEGREDVEERRHLSGGMGGGTRLGLPEGREGILRGR